MAKKKEEVVVVEEVVVEKSTVCPNCEGSGRVCSVCKHGYGVDDIVA